MLALDQNQPEIIAPQIYLEPWERAQAATDLQPRRVLPVHWDIWKAWQEDPRTVAPHLTGSGSELVMLG